ncbi:MULTISPECIES: hypothetical protein [unclassified Streptomyces]|uniref:hypothetical protein n=1 Tax=unclassified Streptomyces TaxID=2593676 RepID=UPI00073B8423|nr:MULTISPECIES: hypothetical protein [unclassified Streptomyces]ODA71937.1 hypothetical protein APS67_003807 [Streptomyces sp. AVP053U2]
MGLLTMRHLRVPAREPAGAPATDVFATFAKEGGRIGGGQLGSGQGGVARCG